MNPATIDSITTALSGGSGLIIIGLLLLLVGTLLLGVVLFALGYDTGWREGRRRWLRTRSPLEASLTEELRKGHRH